MITRKTTYLLKNSNKDFKYFSKKYKSTSEPLKYTPLEYCVRLVRKSDHENYLCSLLLPEKLRATAFAIRAFNIELSKIQEQTNEHIAGIMRIKFWEDSLDRIYDNKPPNHPVLIEVHKCLGNCQEVNLTITPQTGISFELTTECLRSRPKNSLSFKFQAIKKHKLSKLLFKRLLTSRLKQLNVSTFKDMAEMEKYADQTCSPVLMLLLEAFNVRNVNCDHVASHIGRAQGLSNLIRSLPYNLKEKIVLLPMTELIKHNVSEENLLRNSVNPDTLSQIIFEIASVANNHLKVAMSLMEKVPVECKSLFLPAVPVRLFLQKLEKSNFYIYEPQLGAKNGFLPFILYWNKIKKSF